MSGHSSRLHRHLEVHHVAGVVADQQKDSRAGVQSADSCDDVAYRGRGEDLARDDSIQQAGSDVADQRRFMAGSPAREDADVAGMHRSCQHRLRAFQPAHEAAVRANKPREHLLDNVAGVVDELLPAQIAVIPPSAAHTAPVTYEASSDARKHMTLATSSAVPCRPSGMVATIRSCPSGRWT